MRSLDSSLQEAQMEDELRRMKAKRKGEAYPATDLDADAKAQDL